MTTSSILLANNKRIATLERTEGGNQVHNQRINEEPTPLANRIEKFLAESGGSKDLNVDGSSTPVNFDYTNAGDWVLRECVWAIVDGSLSDYDKFGAAALGNGMQFLIMSDDTTEALDLFDGRDVQTLGGLEAQFGKVDVDSGTPDDVAVARFTFDHGLLVPATYIARVVVSDNLTTLTAFTVKVRGEQYA